MKTKRYNPLVLKALYEETCTPNRTVGELKNVLTKRKIALTLMHKIYSYVNENVSNEPNNHMKSKLNLNYFNF